MKPSAILLLATVLFASACLDLAPDPAPIVDAQVTPMPPECSACLVAPSSPGPGCGAELAVCNAEPTCAKATPCLASCYVPSPAAYFACLSTCSQAAGILSADDPAVLPARKVFDCVRGPCSMSCFGADGGLDAGATDAPEQTSANACTSATDMAWMSADHLAASKACGMQCFGNSDVAGCVGACLSGGGQVSPACALCAGHKVECTLTNCLSSCAAADSPACTTCQTTYCQDAFERCTGLAVDDR